jgi:hypothetical protein
MPKYNRPVPATLYLCVRLLRNAASFGRCSSAEGSVLIADEEEVDDHTGFRSVPAQGLRHYSFDSGCSK